MNVVIELKNLNFQYPDGKEALKNVSLRVDQGECVGIIGPNGSGKSTLLMHLNGILPELQNENNSVLILGQWVSKSTYEMIRKKVGLLFQDPDDQLLCPTVFEDVAFGPQQDDLPDPEIRKIVKEALQKVGLENFEERSPHHLSVGEKQRVCLAGVLAYQPEILALDEPTSSLDPRGKRELKSLLKTLPATKIIASHDLELVVELCSRTIVLDQGRVVADGPTLDLLSDEKLMISHGLEKPHILQHSHPHR